jgi:hypothetical protein
LQGQSAVTEDNPELAITNAKEPAHYEAIAL